MQTLNRPPTGPEMRLAIRTVKLIRGRLAGLGVTGKPLYLIDRWVNKLEQRDGRRCEN